MQEFSISDSISVLNDAVSATKDYCSLSRKRAYSNEDNNTRISFSILSDESDCNAIITLDHGVKLNNQARQNARTGTCFRFTLTGDKNGGPLWGTNHYRGDSSISAVWIFSKC